MNTEKFVRCIVTLQVLMLGLFFKFKNPTRVNRGHKKDTKDGVSKSSSSLANSWREFLDNGAQHAGLPDIDNPVRYYYLFLDCANCYLLTKNFIICLLRYETFAKYRYLDCFLLGRFVINGRVIELSPQCACFEAIVLLAWRFAVLKCAPECGMPFVEFLLDRGAHRTFWTRRRPNRPRAQVAPGGPGYSSLLEYLIPFKPRKAGAPGPYRLRPNRTRRAWDTLARSVFNYYIVFVPVITILVFLFLSMCVPVGFSQRAFEYNYRHCIQWVIEEKNGQRLLTASQGGAGAGASLSSSILDPFYGLFLSSKNHSQQQAMIAYERPPVIQEIFMAFSGLVELNSFHLLRLLIDLFDSLMLYLELALIMNCISFMLILASKDVLLYCQLVSRRMESIIAALRREQAGANRLRYGNSVDLFTDFRIYDRLLPTQKAVYFRAEPDIMKADKSEIQVQIADLFNLIKAYNKYVSFQCICLMLYWLAYSLLVSSWIFLPGNESPKLEWYVVHWWATLYAVMVLSRMSDVGTKCRQLHKQISVAMALDRSYTSSKPIWGSLLKFYSPRSLYCFTILNGSVEISTIVGLKLLVWSFSALVIASTFFQVYNIK